MYKPYDGRETAVPGVRTIFRDGRIDGQYQTMINIKGSKSRGIVSFFTQEDDKVGISITLEELQNFMKLL